MLFRFNSIFEPVFTTDADIIDIWGGRGRGGSHFGTEYFLFAMLTMPYFRGFFIRETFADIRDSLWRDFKDRIAEFEERNDVSLKGVINLTDHNMTAVHIPTGNSIVPKGVTKSTGSRTAKMKSLAGATHVLIEEANELSEDDFDQMKLSLRTVKGQEIRVIRIFNPPSKNHWIWRDYTLYPIDDNYFRAEVKEGAHIESIFSTFNNNRKNLDESFLRFVRRYQNSTIQRDIEYYHTEILGLIASGAKGRIYKGWQQCSVAEFDAIQRRSMYVMDFGYSEDPTVIMQMKFEGECVYCRELMYMSGCDNVELMRRMLDMGLTEKDIIIADPGSGGDVRIAELRRGFYIASHPAAAKGLMIYGAHKGPGSIIAGIGAVQGRKIIVTDDSRNTWNEYLGYVWALDREKNPIDKPIEKNDHAMDCIRMGVLNKEKFI